MGHRAFALAAAVLMTTLSACSGSGPVASDTTQTPARSRFEEFARDFTAAATTAGGVKISAVDYVTVVAADGSLIRQVHTPAGQDPGTTIVDLVGGYVYRDRTDVEHRGYGDPADGYVKALTANWPPGAWLRLPLSEQPSRDLLIALLPLLLQKNPKALISVRDLGVAFEVLVAGNLFDPELPPQPYRTFVVEYTGKSTRFQDANNVWMFVDGFEGLDLDPSSFKILDDAPARRSVMRAKLAKVADELARRALALTERDVSLAELRLVSLPQPNDDVLVEMEPGGIAVIDSRVYRNNTQRIGVWVCPGPRTKNPADLLHERPCQ